MKLKLCHHGLRTPDEAFFCNNIPAPDKLGIWGIFSLTIGTILSMGKWIWFFFLQKFLFFKEIYYKLPNMVLAVKNLRSSHQTSVVGVWSHFWLASLQPTKFTPYFGLTSESRLNSLGLYFPPIYLYLIFDILYFEISSSINWIFFPSLNWIFPACVLSLQKSSSK